MRLGVDRNVDDVVRLLLPIVRAGRARCGAYFVRRRQELVELPEGVDVRGALLSRCGALFLRVVVRDSDGSDGEENQAGTA